MARQMKDSEIEWIGEIPVDWDVRKLKTFVKTISKGATPADMSLERNDKYSVAFIKGENIVNGTISYEKTNYITEEDNNKLSRSQLEEDDILFVIAGSIGKCGIVKNLQCITNINQAISFIRLKDNYKYLTRYLYEYFQSNYATLYTKLNTVKSALPNLSMEDLANMYITIPHNKEEQKRIATYLDQQCAHIDTVIEKTKASIEEYKKLKQAIITQAVTKGVRGDRPMKDSGIEWIGNIPADWIIKKLKYCAKTRNEKYNDEEIKDYFALENIVGWTGKYIDTENTYDLSQSCMCYENDVVFGKLRPYLAKVYLVPQKMCCSSEFAIFYDFDGIPDFYKYLFLSYGFVDTVDASTYGTKMPRANIEFIRNMMIAVPQYEEQSEIVLYLKDKITMMDLLIEKKEKALVEMELYKKSLIYEYVTGKKEVPVS